MTTQRYEGEDAPVLQEESSDDTPFDLMPVRKQDPFDVLRRMNWDLCRHGVTADTTVTPPPPPPRMRSATADTNMSSLSHGNNINSDNGLEQILQNAKAAFDDLWQRQQQHKPPSNKIPTEIEATKDVNHLVTVNNKKKKDLDVTTGIRDLGAKVEEEENDDDDDENEDGDEVVWSVIVTEPGTSRAPRVYRGLELFIVAVCILVLTMYLIRQSGIELFFVLESKQCNQK